jgi:hypothetical protein
VFASAVVALLLEHPLVTRAQINEEAKRWRDAEQRCRLILQDPQLP